ncbi:Ig-like domain-containing protein [Sphingomonas jatrophae]|nr:Ig-like domain-containing protein [Sphingomonas jatrophae]
MVNLVRRVGGELLVNTQVNGAQQAPTVTWLAGGGFVVTWQDTNSLSGADSTASIKAQMFDAAGTRVGAELLVNTAGTGFKYEPTTTGLANGGFVVTWHDGSNTLGDASGTSIKAQIFSASGAKVGSEFRVNTQVNADQSMATITNLAGGGFVISWQDSSGTLGDTSSSSVKAQIYNAAGTKVGGEFLVNTQTASAQFQPSITSLAGGGFVVSWRDESTSLYGGDYTIKAQLFSATGAKTGAEFLIDATASRGNYGVPQLARLENGGFVATWLALEGVKAQVFDASGVKVGGETLVTPGIRTGIQLNIGPAVTGTADGGFAVTWVQAQAGAGEPTGQNIHAQTFDATGARVGSTFMVNSETLSSQDLPTIAGIAGGGFVVSWQDQSGTLGDASSLSIKAQVFGMAAAAAPTALALSSTSVDEGAGTLTGATVGTLSVTDADFNDVLTYTLLADSSEGGFAILGGKLVVADAAKLDYETNSTPTVTVRATDAGGHTIDRTFTITLRDVDETRPATKVGGEFLVNTVTAGSQSDPAIARLADGGFVVTWANGNDVLAQRFDAAGAKLGGEFVANTSTHGYQAAPTVGALSGGGFVIGWEDFTPLGADTSGTSVRVQVFGASGTKVDGPFVAATQTAGDQLAPSIVGMADGNFVVTWQDGSATLGDAEGTSIKAQIFTSGGAKVGSETLVNTKTDGWENMPSVAALAGGGFVVTWYYGATAGRPAPGSSLESNIKAQLFDAAGNRVGGELPVNTQGANFQGMPVVGALAGGGFVVSWTDYSGTLGDTSEDSVKAQLFDAAGNRLGGEFLVNTMTASSQLAPTISALPDGGFVISWQDGSGTLGDASATSIKAQAFTASGSRIGREFLVNTNTANAQGAPAIATLTNGKIVVAWQDGSGTLGDTSGTSIKAQIVALVGPAAPVAAADSFTTTEDTVLTIAGPGVLANDTDANGDVLTAQPFSGPAHGTLTLDQSGGFVYTPFADFTGTDSFTYMAHDGTSLGNAATVTITVTAVDDAAVAVADNAAILENQTATIAVLANDRDPDSPLAIARIDGTAIVAGASVTLASGAIVTLNADGTIGYDPHGAFDTLISPGTGPGTTAATDSFTYTLAGGGSATVSVGITGVGVADDGTGGLVRRHGDEVLVNTETWSYQTEPSISWLADGGYVVTWQDLSGTLGDADGASIKMQRFDAAGNKVGAETLVNTATASAQSTPSVTGLPNGGFVTTWQDFSRAGNPADYDGSGIKAQLFDAAGAKVGSELLVNTQLPGNQEAPVVTDLAGGGFVITWSDPSGTLGDTSYTSIKGQIYNATGGRIGSEFRVNTQTAQQQERAVVQGLTNGGFVVTWEDRSKTLGDSSESSIKAQLFGASGAKIGGEFLVNTVTEGNQSNPTVAELADGSFVIGWSGPDGQQAQLFSATGAKLGGEFAIGSGQQLTLSAATGGWFVATWTQVNGEGGNATGNDVVAQVFDGSGARLGGTFVVSASAAGHQGNPAVSRLPAGGFVVTWEDASPGNGDGSYNGLKAQAFRFETAGAPTDMSLSSTVVDEGRGTVAGFAIGRFGITDPDVNDRFTYTILSDATGGGFAIAGDQLVVADPARLDYETNAAPAITVRGTDAAGNVIDRTFTITVRDGDETRRVEKVGGEVLVNTGTFGAQSDPTVTRLAGGGFVVTWTDNYDNVRAQLFDNAGGKVGGELSVNTQTANTQDGAAVAALAGGGFVVSWQDGSGTLGDNDGTSIKAQRFDATGAKVGGEFLVNSLTAGGQSDVAIAGLAGGGFVVTWYDWTQPHEPADGSGEGVHAQIFDAGGNRVGGEFNVNTYSLNSQFDAKVTGLADGGFVVTWTDGSMTLGDTAGYSVKGQRYDAAGAPVGSEFLVNTTTRSVQAEADVTALPGGGFVVVWRDTSYTLGDADGTSIKAQLFGASGEKLGGEFLVNATTAHDQTAPSVAVLSDGGFVVTWDNRGSDNGFNSNASEVRGQAFTATGNKVGGEFLVNTQSAGDQSTSDVVALADGRFVVVWQDDGQTGGDDSYLAIKAQILAVAAPTPPVASADAYVVDEDGSLVVPAASGVLANDGGGDGPLTAVLVSGPAHGVLSLAPSGGFTYAPVSNYAGNDSFTYRPFDGALYGAPVAVMISVAAVDDPAVAGNDVATVAENRSATIAVLANDADPDSELAVAAVNGTAIARGQTVTLASGALVRLNADGTLDYDPNQKFDALVAPGGAGASTATDSFSYTLASGGSATVTVTITGVDQTTETYVGTAGADTFSINIATLSSQDTVSGGAGNDTLALSGTGALPASALAGMNSIEVLTLLNGGMSLAFNDAVAAANGPTLTVNGSAGNDAVDFSAVTLATRTLAVRSGGGNDVFRGGGGNDVFRFAAAELTAADTVVGGGGTIDQLVFETAGAVSAASMAGVSGIERYVLAAGGNALTFNAANAAGVAGGVIQVITSVGNDSVNGTALTDAVLEISASGGLDTIYGTSGGDTVRIGGSDLAGDTINGFSGYDNIVVTSADTLSVADLAGLANVDQITLNAAGTSVTINNAIAGANAGVLAVYGSSGNDIVDGSSVTLATRSLAITALGGNDVFRGGVGYDVFRFNMAELTSGDTVAGGSGAGVDAINFMTAGTLAAGALANVSGIERLTFVAGANAVTLGDAFVGSATGQRVVVYGNNGSDTVDGAGLTGANRIEIYAGLGNDVLRGGAANDLFRFAAAGLDGSDLVAGGAGYDELSISTGGQLSAAQLANVSGIDQITFATGGLSVTLDNAVAAANGATLTMFGSAGNDSVDASAVTDTTRGINAVAGAGNDSFRGGLGADTFRFAAGDLTAADIVSGGGGSAVDALQITTAGTVAAAALARVSGIEAVSLNVADIRLSLSDAFVGSASNRAVTIYTSAGADYVNAAAVTTVGNRIDVALTTGDDTVIGGAGDDTIRVAAANLTAGDTLSGGGGRDTLVLNGTGMISLGGNVSGMEALTLASGLQLTVSSAFAAANAASFTINASGGSDQIDLAAVSSATSYTINAGFGNDRILGGDGADIFNFAATELNGADTIRGGEGSAIDTLRMTTAGTIVLTGMASFEAIILADGTNNLALTNNQLGSAYGGRMTVAGGSGNDTLSTTGVSSASNRIEFGAGAGNDSYIGGAGIDVLKIAAAELTAGDSFTGGGGSAVDVVEFTTAGAVGATSGVTGVERFQLNAGGNSLAIGDATVASATNATLTIVGAGGDDVIDASAVASGRRVIVSAGVGDDVLEGGAGSDTLDGGTGDDRVWYDAADTSASGGTHVEGDTLMVRTAATIDLRLADQVSGDAGTTTGFEHVDAYHATAGVTMRGSDGFFSRLTGGHGQDTITAGASGALISGGAGADTLIGGQGEDTFLFDAGDVVAGETVSGGSGAANEAYFYADADFSTGSYRQITNTVLTGFRDGAYADVSLTLRMEDIYAFTPGGQITANQVTSDTVETFVVQMAGIQGGEFHNFHLVGFEANDRFVINGGSGATQIVGTDLAVTIVNAGDGDDVIQNSTHGSWLSGSVINGDAGNDRIGYTAGAGVTLDGGAGTDTLVFGTHNDYLPPLGLRIELGAADQTAGDEADVRGFENVDWTNGVDVEIVGSSAANVIHGGRYGDVIEGAGGADSLTGGEGGDTFVFRARYAEGDTILDFDAADGFLFDQDAYGTDGQIDRLIDDTTGQSGLIGADIVRYLATSLDDVDDVETYLAANGTGGPAGLFVVGQSAAGHTMLFHAANGSGADGSVTLIADLMSASASAISLNDFAWLT